ncbi:MAG: secondary thiamine-phosphate synthase enzyme YjbQ [Candidatus Eremiobacteraeota bacterium]|nr:secondary thiamine-phosphate synthase enzyme YjbQ [Candidatus Eremiobacteraeota bacterium]
MHVHRASLEVATSGGGQVIDITSQVAAEVTRSSILEGLATVFVPGATAAVTTIEYEDGLVADFARTWEELVPEGRRYAHNVRWGDGNGHSHVRASMLGPSLSVPVEKGALILGTWQQIILVDFDNRPRSRRYVCQVMGLRGGE